MKGSLSYSSILFPIGLELFFAYLWFCWAKAERNLQIYKFQNYKFTYLTLCDYMDCSLPGSSVRGILQARLLEWVAISFSKKADESV